MNCFETKNNYKKRLICFFIFMLLPLSCAGEIDNLNSEIKTPERDISQVENLIIEAVSSSEQLSLRIIGEVAYDYFKAPIWMISFVPQEEPLFEVFLSGGVHGNEPAGVEILLQFIEALAENPHKYNNISFDIVPLVNPWGWSHDFRFNYDGRDINRDFASFKSQEARIIKDFVTNREYDLIIDCHEDPDATGFYLYQLANPCKLLSREIIEEIRNMGYPIEQDVRMIVLKTKDGLIDAPLWSLWFVKMVRQLSLTNYLRLNNNDQVYVIETPTNLPLEERIKMQEKALRLMISSLLL